MLKPFDPYPENLEDVYFVDDYTKWKWLQERRKILSTELKLVFDALDKIDVKESWLLGGE